MTPTRRALLQGGLALGGLSALGLPGLGGLGSTAAFAAAPEDLYFVFAYFSGGWDVLQSVDPRDPRIFRDDRKKVTRIQPAYDRLPSGRRDLVRTSVDGMVFGPSIGDLAGVADKLTVVRGMSMDTLTHEVGRRRFLTGRPPAGLQAQGSSLATVLSAELGATEAIPQLSVRVESYNDGLPSFASAIRVNSVEDLLRALRPSNAALPSGEQAAVEALLAQVAECERVQVSPFQSQALGFRQAAKDLVALGLDSRFDFTANTAEMEALRDLYGIDPRDLAGAPAQAAAAVTALTSGISRCVSFEAAQGLDTHGPEWAYSHGPRLEAGFDVLAALIADLDRRPYKDGSSSWLDHTIVVGFSEFARSTLLNSSGGRDHHLLNACVLAGGGLPGGRVLGASSDAGMAPQRLDYQTGVPSPGGEIVRPENLFAALQEYAGIAGDPGGLSAAPFRALIG